MEGGWTVEFSGYSDLIEPDPSFRRLTDDELAQLRQPTSTTELWGISDFVGDSGYHEPSRRSQPTCIYPKIALRKLAMDDDAGYASDESSSRIAAPPTLALARDPCRRTYNSRRIDEDFIMDSGASMHMVGVDKVEHLRHTFKELDTPMVISTTNGPIELSQYVDLRLPCLTELQPFLIGEVGAPSLISLGELCLHKGCAYVWKSGWLPYLVPPSGHVVNLPVR
jgi:hypothetical protein